MSIKNKPLKRTCRAHVRDVHSLSVHMPQTVYDALRKKAFESGVTSLSLEATKAIAAWCGCETMEA